MVGEIMTEREKALDDARFWLANSRAIRLGISGRTAYPWEAPWCFQMAQYSRRQAQEATND